MQQTLDCHMLYLNGLKEVTWDIKVEELNNALMAVQDEKEAEVGGDMDEIKIQYEVAVARTEFLTKLISEDEIRKYFLMLKDYKILMH